MNSGGIQPKLPHDMMLLTITCDNVLIQWNIFNPAMARTSAHFSALRKRSVSVSRENKSSCFDHRWSFVVDFLEVIDDLCLFSKFICSCQLKALLQATWNKT